MFYRLGSLVSIVMMFFVLFSFMLLLLSSFLVVKCSVML